MNVPREAQAEALFALLSATQLNGQPAFVTASREFQPWDSTPEPNQPALFLVDGNELAQQQGSYGETKWKNRFVAFIYCMHSPMTTPATQTGVYPPSGGGGTPSGAAGGDLTGTYPNPTVNSINGQGTGAIFPSGVLTGNKTLATLDQIPAQSVQAGYQPNQVLSGCGVDYLTGLTYQIGACTFTINGAPSPRLRSRRPSQHLPGPRSDSDGTR